jgi:hypothetical protein
VIAGLIALMVAYLGLLLGQGDPVWVALGGFGGAVLCGLAAVQA